MRAIRLQVLAQWRKMRESFWFLPALMVAVAATLAMFFGWADMQLARGRFLHWPSWLAVQDAENVRSLLAMIAGSMITVAGVTFSVVIVALAQASAQFGPRLLRQFMRDRGNQTVLGAFVATFVYCSLVLTQIHPLQDGGQYVPRLSALVALLLALASIGVLVFFYHHVAKSIQADQVVVRAGDLLEATVREIFPEVEEDGSDDEGRPKRWEEDLDPEGKAQEVIGDTTGYVADIDQSALLQVAVDHELVIEMQVESGDFIIEGHTIAQVYRRNTASEANSTEDQEPEEDGDEASDSKGDGDGDGHDDEAGGNEEGNGEGEGEGEREPEEISSKILQVLQMVRRRSVSQDIDLAINRVAEIAVRALSPGINDPYTAMAAVDRLGAALVMMAERREPPRVLRDEDGVVCVWLGAITYDELLDHAFLLIVRYGRDNVEVLNRVLEALALVASRAQEPHLQDAVERHAKVIRDLAEALPHDQDRQRVETSVQGVLDLLKGRASNSSNRKSSPTNGETS